MQATDTDGRLTTPTTRRTVVATGAKLAYAAPLVATSLKLSALNVAATHSPGHGDACPEAFVCGGTIPVCGDDPAPGALRPCVCAKTTEGNNACFRDTF